ncbi:glycosyltransferase family 2 protein [Paracoccus zeaxanthinifaciens]|uniref:glycosyltransferase family 2 protein n=1 Tax=Paracoccus zeaxanthinifaciens TaxID=187400 RepID=UPI00041D02A1|nr:glycosyltransferase family 2 protein [Paracoccus zeaxanthinifaciens]
MPRSSIIGRTIRSQEMLLPEGFPRSSLRLLDALATADSNVVRMYFEQIDDLRAFGPARSGDVQQMRGFSGALLAEMRVPNGRDVASPFGPPGGQIAPSPAEHDLLAGRDVLLGHCNGEDAATLSDWLLWHHRVHRATGALIVDRGHPGEAERKAAELHRVMSATEEGRAALDAMVIAIVDFDSPLGDPLKGPEAHPMNAPDAPGKDRMEQPAAEPWTAPLGNRLLFDLLRHRLLGAATAVANIETIDLIDPIAGSTVFDAAKGVETGFLSLLGERAYPWGVRNDAVPRFGDHICKRFDGRARDWRWCAAMDRLPSNTIWVRDRILGAANAPEPVRFIRHMALRYGQDESGKVSRIVPKTSLVEADDLLARAIAAGADPLRQPKADIAENASHDTDGTRRDGVTIVTTMKNEGPFILEWIAYHRAIGVENFLVYTNDCTDGTDDLLRLLARKGYCEWRENPYREVDMKPQHAALHAADSEDMVKNADWLICMDVDEYIAVHVGDGTMKALFDAANDANLISLTWRLFGNADITDFRDGFITQQFFRCAKEFANKPHQAWGFKTLYRNMGLFKKMGVHRPKGLQPNALDAIRWINGSGKAMPQDQWRNAWRSHSGTYGYQLASLNHYAVRSVESFLVKRDRGRVNHVDRDQGLAYWFRMNHNVEEDRRMEAVLPLLQAEYDSMMADPEIRAMHESCVAAHRAKIDELKVQPAYSAFFQELQTDRMRKLSKLHGHFGSNVYLAGPTVIPDEIVEKPADSDFFFTVDRVETTEH